MKTTVTTTPWGTPTCTASPKTTVRFHHSASELANLGLRNGDRRPKYLTDIDTRQPRNPPPSPIPFPQSPSLLLPLRKLLLFSAPAFACQVSNPSPSLRWLGSELAHSHSLHRTHFIPHKQSVRTSPSNCPLPHPTKPYSPHLPPSTPKQAYETPSGTITITATLIPSAVQSAVTSAGGVWDGEPVRSSIIPAVSSAVASVGGVWDGEPVRSSVIPAVTSVLGGWDGSSK